ncbi:MAG: neutral/alkaline non-lysosomal ceramidase N-terminal domain-containing protein [Solitalea sp.]
MQYLAKIICLLSLVVYTPGAAALPGNGGWKAGVARIRITPDEPMWMGGYAARNRPAEGTGIELWAKALALEDATGKRVLLITTDLLGIPAALSSKIRGRIKALFGLERDAVMLNSSHTHSGPALARSLANANPVDPEVTQKINAYSERLVEMIVQVAGDALRSVAPARVYAGNGVTRFQVNRRNNNESQIGSVTDLAGPNDYAVPVILVENQQGKPMAIAFGYACHATVLSGYDWSGDYPGYAQLELEQMHPGATALFFQGAGGDQNPMPRHTVALARQYGRTLAAAVDRVLSDGLRELEPRIRTAYAEIGLELSAPPAREEVARIASESSGFMKRWAERLLSQLEAGDPVMDSYPYPLQAWKLGDQPVLALGGEVVVEYAIELKRLFGQDIFVLGYSNDVMGYIPSLRILREGGYEGAVSQMVYGLPGPWSWNVEAQIISKMEELAARAGILKVPKNK